MTPGKHGTHAHTHARAEEEFFLLWTRARARRTDRSGRRRTLRMGADEDAGDDSDVTTTTTTTTTAFVDYAPYYTRQPREETWRKQRELWGRTLVRCVGFIRLDQKVTDVFHFCGVDRAVRDRERPAVHVKTEKIFENKTIDRSLALDARKEVIEYLRERGEAWWLDKEETVAGVLDAGDLQRYVDAMGELVTKYALSGKVYTMDELRDPGGIAGGTALGGLDSERLARAVQSACDRGLCVVFGASTAGDSSVGVKFA
jgi:hypothetical protein